MGLEPIPERLLRPPTGTAIWKSSECDRRIRIVTNGNAIDSGIARFLLDFDRAEAVRRRLREQRLERFIGVIYRPDTELMSHYAGASLSQQFDAFVWFDETHAVTPLGPQHIKAGVPDTYPFGV